MDEQDVQKNFARRMIFSLLKPAAVLGDTMGIELKTFTTMAQLAIYQQKKRRGLTQSEISKQLGVSSRTLDRVLKIMRNGFFEPESDHELPRKIEFILWGEPCGLARLVQLLDGYSAEEIQQALDVLVEEERARPIEGRTLKWGVTRRANRLSDDKLAAKIDGLNNVLGVISNAVWNRFFKESPQAGARTVTMLIRQEDIPELKQLYETYIWPRLVELDAQAQESQDSVEMGVTMVWSRSEHQE